MKDFGSPPMTFDVRVMSFPTGRAESDQAVFFESFSPGNFVIGVKMVNGCSFPEGNPLRNFWTFFGGLTNAETEILVEDTVTCQTATGAIPPESFPEPWATPRPSPAPQVRPCSPAGRMTIPLACSAAASGSPAG